MAAVSHRTFDPTAAQLRNLYDALYATYGAQPWWPAETPFEVMVGAVLTQNAAWAYVEKAITQLRGRGLLSLDDIVGSTHEALADAVRPSGYFNIKARRLRNLCECLDACGGVAAFAALDAATQRDTLLRVNGIGPETADDILLYALNRPVFVIDTYTRRLLKRHALAAGDEDYEVLRGGFERVLPADVALYQQYHALIVVHAKAACRKAPLCAGCALQGSCPTGR